MTKKFLTFAILFIVLAGVLAPECCVWDCLYPSRNKSGGQDVSSGGQTFCVAREVLSNNPTTAIKNVVSWTFGALADPLFKGAGYILMTLSGLI